MAAPLPLRPDFDAEALRREARRSRDAAQARRLLALAAIYDGGTRSEAAKIGGVTLQIVRDWVVRFNAEGPAGLIDRKAPGSAPKLGAAERQALAQMVERGPIPAVHGVVRWRLVDLAQWVWEEFRISISTQTLSRELGPWVLINESWYQTAGEIMAAQRRAQGPCARSPRYERWGIGSRRHTEPRPRWRKSRAADQFQRGIGTCFSAPHSETRRRNTTRRAYSEARRDHA